MTERNVYVNEFPWGMGHGSTIYDPQSRVVIEFFYGNEGPRALEFDSKNKRHKRRYITKAIQMPISEEAYQEMVKIPGQLGQLQETRGLMTKLSHKESELKGTLKDQEKTIREAIYDPVRKLRYRRLGKEMPQE